MSLRGELREFELPDIMQLIASQKKAGWLKIISKGICHFVFFRDGKITSTKNPADEDTIAKWIKQLDSNRFAERNEASNNLEAAGKVAFPAEEVDGCRARDDADEKGVADRPGNDVGRVEVPDGLLLLGVVVPGNDGTARSRQRGDPNGRRGE